MEDSLPITVTFTAGESYAELPIFLALTNANGEELAIDLTFTDEVLQASLAPIARGGVKVLVDSGAGLQQIAYSELGTGHTLTESLGGDADAFTFSRVGRNLSPWLTRWLQGRHQIEAWFYLGAPASEYGVKMFSGVFTASSFDGNAGHITCLDNAIKYSQIQASLNLAPNHGKTLRQIIVDLCAEYGLTSPEIDLGPVGEVPRKKPIQQAEVGLIDLIRSVASPACARVWFADGRLQVRRLDFDEASVRTVYVRDLAPDSFGGTLPDAASKNSVTAVTVRFDQQPLELVADAPVTQSVFETYARKGAQNYRSTGSVTGVPWFEVPFYRETQRIVTKRWRMGSTVVRSEVWKYAFHGRRAVDRKINSAGVVTDYTTTTIYQWEDGLWYADYREVFRLISIDVEEKTLDSSNNVTAETQLHYGWHMARTAIYNEADSSPFIGTNPILLTGDGIGAAHYAEYFGNFPDITFVALPPTTSLYPITKAVVEYVADSDGFITSRVETLSAYSLGAEVGGSSNYGYSYDIDRSARYQYGTDALRVVTVTEDAYEQDANPQNGYSLTSSTVSAGATPVVTISSGDVRPHIETVQALSDSQEMRVESVDEVRVYLNGAQVDQIHTEFAETEAELDLISTDAIRTAGAWPVPLTMPIELLIRKGTWFTLTLNSAELGISSIRLWCTDVTRDFDAFTQTVQAQYFPVELS